MAASPLRMVKALLKRDDAPALQQQIASLKSEAGEACAEIERLQGERALGDSYDAAVLIDERIKRQEWVVEHADRALPELELRLAALRQLEQAEALARHKAILCAIYPRLKAAITEAGRVQQELIDARTAAIATLGESLVSRELPIITYGGFVTPDLIRLWSDQNDRVLEALQRKPKSAPPAPPRALPKPAAAKPVVPPPAPRPVRPPRRDEAADGQRLVFVLRTGFEHGGSQCVAGDIVALPSEDAAWVVSSGAGDYADQAPARSAAKEAGNG